LLFIKPPAMRCFFLTLVVLMNLRVSISQVFVGTCPIPDPPISWTDEAATSLGFSSYTGNVRIIGTLTIDVTTFTFSGAEVGVLSGGQNIVNPGCTLRVTDGSIITNTQEIWAGITVLQGGRIEVEESDICGASSALEIQNDVASSVPLAEFQIVNSGLRRCGTGIFLQSNFPGTTVTYPGYVVGTHFEGGILPTGGFYSHSYWGIFANFINGGAGLTIGADNTIASANLFTNMDYGVLV
jgi:hypothetical protein